MVDSPQDVYARSLLSHNGYPLRTPEPNIELPDSYQREGLKIGDVGVVVPEEGCFDVFFNITLPLGHPLHASDGVPDNFTQIQLKREDYRITPDAERPGRVLSPATVTCTVGCVDPFLVDGASRRLTDHQFSLHHNEGAMLILPQGAERHRLAKDLLLLDAVLQNAVDWYRFAREKLYRDISNDALYLITGFHKAPSWSLASFRNTRASFARCKIVQLRKAGPMICDDSTWETARPLEWRIGPRHIVDVANQSVFIVGFKIAVNKELLYMQRVTVKVGHSERTLATTLVGFGSTLANMLSWVTSKGMDASEAAHNHENIESTPQDTSSGGEPEGVQVERVPQVSQPFHPSDIINQYMFKKEPSAKIAVTHDSQWIALLEKGILTQQDMLQKGRLEEAISQEYNIITKDGAAYLQPIHPNEPTITSMMVTTGIGYPARNIVFIGEIGAGKSSAIDLLLETGAASPVVTYFPHGKALYKATLNGTKYNLWDSCSLLDLSQTVLAEPLGSGLEMFLKEIHSNHEIDLLVYCVHGSRAIGASAKHYNDVCAITRRLVSPVVILVTGLEEERDMEDWWRRNATHLQELGMEFDDHACITTFLGHPRRAESKEKLVELISKEHRWKARGGGFYFGSFVKNSTYFLSPHKEGPLDLGNAMDRVSVGEEFGRHPSEYSDFSTPSLTHSGDSTTDARSFLPSSLFESPTPFNTATSATSLRTLWPMKTKPMLTREPLRLDRERKSLVVPKKRKPTIPSTPVFSFNPKFNPVPSGRQDPPVSPSAGPSAPRDPASPHDDFVHRGVHDQLYLTDDTQKWFHAYPQWSSTGHSTSPGPPARTYDASVLYSAPVHGYGPLGPQSGHPAEAYPMVTHAERPLPYNNPVYPDSSGDSRPPQG